MESWALILANVLGIAAFFGGIALCVRFDQQGKTRRREFEHAERMRAIELGRSLDDALVARSQALGAVGVTVPIVTFSAAALGSCIALQLREPVWQFGSMVVIWIVCGSVCLAILPLVVTRLREVPPSLPTEKFASPSGAFTATLPEKQKLP